MRDIIFKGIVTFVLAAVVTGLSGQTVPAGINYQAVARDDAGRELTDREIDVRFSVIVNNPLGPVVYQELHQEVKTSRYGVFSLVIGSGTPVGGTAESVAAVDWGAGDHFLKVEVRFLNEFTNMGTMQFMAVPYALFALQSLHPGPQGPEGPPGPQGPPGDPASNDQQLSFEGQNLSISGGNTVNLSSLTRPPQDLVLTGNLLRISNNPEATDIDLSKYLDNTDEQSLLWNPATRELGITNSTSQVDLSRVLQYNEESGALTINGGNSVVLNRILSYDPSTAELSLSGGNSVNLTRELEYNSENGTLSIQGGNSVDISQALSFDEESNMLTILNGNSVSLASLTDEVITSMTIEGSELVVAEGDHESRLDFSEHMIAFRANRTVSEDAPQLADVVFTPTEIEYNDGGGFNSSTGEFTAPATGIYTFNVSYLADGSGGDRKVRLHHNSDPYEDIAIDLSGGSNILVRSITMRLVAGDSVTMVISTGTATQTGTGTFSGFRVW